MKLLRLYALLLWIALPLTAFRYWVVWNELPATLATRFDPQDLRQPTAFTTRIHALEVGLVACGSIALIAWVALNLRVKRTVADLGGWLWLTGLYCLMGVVVSVQHVLLQSQLIGSGMDMNARRVLNSLIPIPTSFVAVVLSCVAGWQLWTSLTSSDD